MTEDSTGQAVPDVGAASPRSEGWVVARRNGFGAWYVLSRRVHRTRVGARLEVVDDRCEVVVPWQGAQAETLSYRSAHDLLPKGQLP